MKYLIIGNGIAAIEAANSIRINDKNGEINLVSKEQMPSYYRTRLPDVLAGKVSADEILVKKSQWYIDNNIKCLLNTNIVKIDAIEKVIYTEKGEKISFNKLLIASGAYCFIPNIKGIDSENVFSIRSSDDCNRLMQYCKNVKSLLVLGAGLLGIEVAYSLLNICKDIVVLESFNRILPRQLDEQGSICLENLLIEKGLKFIKGDTLAQLNGNEAILASNNKLNVGAVIVSAGVRSNLHLASETGIECINGITVDEFMRTSKEDIFAAGDCVEFEGRCFGLWMPAVEQGKIAGLNMVGIEQKFIPKPPESRLKVAGISVLSAGVFEAEDAKIKTFSEKGIYKKLVIKDNELLGVISIGDDAFAMQASKVMSKKAPLETIDF